MECFLAVGFGGETQTAGFLASGRRAGGGDPGGDRFPTECLAEGSCGLLSARVTVPAFDVDGSSISGCSATWRGVAGGSFFCTCRSCICAWARICFACELRPSVGVGGGSEDRPRREEALRVAASDTDDWSHGVVEETALGTTLEGDSPLGSR